MKRERKMLQRTVDMLFFTDGHQKEPADFVHNNDTSFLVFFGKCRIFRGYTLIFIIASERKRLHMLFAIFQKTVEMLNTFYFLPFSEDARRLRNGFSYNNGKLAIFLSNVHKFQPSIPETLPSLILAKPPGKGYTDVNLRGTQNRRETQTQ